MNKFEKQVLDIRHKLVVVFIDFTDILGDVPFPIRRFPATIPKSKRCRSILRKKKDREVNGAKYYNMNVVHLPTLYLIFGKNNVISFGKIFDLSVDNWEDIVKIHVKLRRYGI